MAQVPGHCQGLGWGHAQAGQQLAQQRVAGAVGAVLVAAGVEEGEGQQALLLGGQACGGAGSWDRCLLPAGSLQKVRGWLLTSKLLQGCEAVRAAGGVCGMHAWLPHLLTWPGALARAMNRVMLLVLPVLPVVLVVSMVLPVLALTVPLMLQVLGPAALLVGLAC